MTAADAYRQALRLGLTLEPRGDKLIVRPGDRCPADLAAQLRQHKAEVLALLNTDGRPVRCCSPWVHVAEQVLSGEFDRADLSTIESLTIGLRAIPHPLCRAAMTRLPANKEKPRAAK